MATMTAAVLMTCPECGATCGMKIDTADLTTVECADCAETFTPQEAIDSLAVAGERWEHFRDWLAAAGQV